MTKTGSQMRSNLNIAQVCGGFMQQRYITKNAAHAPHILIFKIGAVAPA